LSVVVGQPRRLLQPNSAVGPPYQHKPVVTTSASTTLFSTIRHYTIVPCHVR